MIKTARKEYDCMACEWLFNDGVEPGVLTFPELRSIIKAEKNNGKILKGQKYIYYRGKDIEGKNYTFRAIPEIDAICKRLDIYQYQ